MRIFCADLNFQLWVSEIHSYIFDFGHIHCCQKSNSCKPRTEWQTVQILMRRLATICLIRICTVCSVSVLVCQAERFKTLQLNSCLLLLCTFLTLPDTRGTWRPRRMLCICVSAALFSWFTHADLVPLVTKRLTVHFMFDPGHVEYALGVLMGWKFSTWAGFELFFCFVYIFVFCCCFFVFVFFLLLFVLFIFVSFFLRFFFFFFFFFLLFWFVFLLFLSTLPFGVIRRLCSVTLAFPAHLLLEWSGRLVQSPGLIA